LYIPPYEEDDAGIEYGAIDPLAAMMVNVMGPGKNSSLV